MEDDSHEFSSTVLGDVVDNVMVWILPAHSLFRMAVNRSWVYYNNWIPDSKMAPIQLNKNFSMFILELQLMVENVFLGHRGFSCSTAVDHWDKSAERLLATPYPALFTHHQNRQVFFFWCFWTVYLLRVCLLPPVVDTWTDLYYQNTLAVTTAN